MGAMSRTTIRSTSTPRWVARQHPARRSDRGESGIVRRSGTDICAASRITMRRSYDGSFLSACRPEIRDRDAILARTVDKALRRLRLSRYCTALREVGRNNREIAVHIDYCFGEVHGIRAIVGEHGVRRPVEFTMPPAESIFAGLWRAGPQIFNQRGFGAWMKRKVSWGLGKLRVMITPPRARQVSLFRVPCDHPHRMLPWMRGNNR